VFFLDGRLLSTQSIGGTRLKKIYNKSRAKRSRQTEFDPAFWEIPVEQDILNQFSNEQHPYYESAEDVRARCRRGEWTARLMPLVEKLIDEYLTPRQKEVVHLYFIRQMTVYEIAEQLGISVPSVSQHLFGKSRDGKITGGAIPKLRKKLAQLHPDEWEITPTGD
jgi:RNA polymerase sigma factor (sigma-70 family)